MLISPIDEDEFIKNLQDARSQDPATNFYAAFLGLLSSPQNLNSVLCHHPIDLLINGLKHLIKYKLEYLKVSENIITIVEALLSYEKNVDSLIINLLRCGYSKQVYGMFERNKKYFDKYLNSLWFVVLICDEVDYKEYEFYARDLLYKHMSEIIENDVHMKYFLIDGMYKEQSIGTTDQLDYLDYQDMNFEPRGRYESSIGLSCKRVDGKDLAIKRFKEDKFHDRSSEEPYFYERKRVAKGKNKTGYLNELCSMVKGNKYTKDKILVNDSSLFPYLSKVTEKDLKILFTPTASQNLAFRLSIDLELNILFILENAQNWDFHVSLLLNDYITSGTIGINALRFIVSLPHKYNTTRLINAIRHKFGFSLFPVLYDILFYNSTEEIKPPVIDYLEHLRSRDAATYENIKSMCIFWIPLGAAIDSILLPYNVDSMVKSLYGINFSRYFSLVKDMEKNRKVIIPKESYAQMIKLSYGWDNYVQVYFWKILAMQKIHLGLSVEAKELLSMEAKEGMMIIKNIK